jgi:hypothetical protein
LRVDADAFIHLWLGTIEITSVVIDAGEGRGLCEAFKASVPNTLVSMMRADLQHNMTIIERMPQKKCYTVLTNVVR